ncbi:MAG: N-acetylmuramoyl-L-alanine amidase [Deltaproteobacteria bacterium]|nr:N-acetylmuramoyl-L-alanine amidase [Deltaproteobacteria bacterium]
MKLSVKKVSLALAVVGLLSTQPVASPSHGDGPALRGAVERPVAEKPGRFVGVPTQPPIQRVRQGQRTSGTLAGKTVYVSAGHGWMFTAGAWRTQRGNTHNLVEDFITIEAVNEYLIPYLHAMGAYVVPVRESDLNPNLVIVDDVDATIEGELAEVATTERGWGAYTTPFESIDLQPFAQGTTRLMTAAATETGRAVFPATFAESGFYNVYISYVQGPNRVADAHVVVNHAGGESHIRVDQRRHGSTWVLLGKWYFEAGAAPEQASIAIANDSMQPGGVISFDAVRFGGGMAEQLRSGTTTGRAAFESASVSSTQLLGAPRDVYDFFGLDSSDDVVARPRFAAWEHEAGEDAIYVAYHTNAPSPVRGTQSIAFGNTYPCCQGLDDFAGVAGSLELLHAVHDEVMADLKAVYDPNWRSAGKVTAALGELNTTHNNEMPSILVELAFHDTAADAEALRDPRFRNVSARAMAQGIAKYFATKDGRALVLPPEPPTAVRVENAGPGALRISWRPPAADAASGAAPSSYRVYLSDNGYGFDDGVIVEGETLVLDGLPRAALRFVRVASVNDGGESMQTEVVGARLAASGAASVLVVGGFDRLDKFQMISQAAPLVGTVDRSRLDRMNDGTYAARHGKAISDAGYAFDGATNEAIAERDVDLTAYKAVDWFVGEQSNPGALPEAARAELARFFAGGGSILLSGSELVWALDSQGTPDDQLFVRGMFHVSLGTDDAETYDVTALAGPFAALAPLSFQDTATGGYDARFPDVLVPGEGATAVLAYGGEPAGGAAAIAWDQGILLGFPFELVQGAKTRSDLIGAALAHFGIEKDRDQPADWDPTGDEDPPTAGCGCASGGDVPGGTLLVVALALVLGRRRRDQR